MTFKMKSNILKTSLFLLFIVITLFSCQTKSTEPNIEKVICDLTNEFPQLPKGKPNQSDFYKLVRSVTNGECNFKLQLFSTPDSIKDKQQIIILINSKGNYCAIPLFSNKYRDYWNFEFEKPIEGVISTNTTFEKEFIKAINSLELNDTIGTGAKVLDEILLSLLHCQSIKENDSVFFERFSLTNYQDQPVEDFDSCRIRQRKNFKEILKGIHPRESYYNYNAYLDIRNDRIIQIINQGQNRKKKFNPQIKTFRQNCNTTF